MSESGVVAPLALRKRDPARNQHRYYLLAVQPNLFGGWSLLREWGRIGCAGQARIELCDSLKDAEDRFMRKQQEKQGRGYVAVTGWESYAPEKSKF